MGLTTRNTASTRVTAAGNGCLRRAANNPEVSIEEIRLIWKMRTIPKTHQSDTEEKI